MTYEIYEGNMERLEKKLFRIARKCEKYGCDFQYRKIGEVFHEFKIKDLPDVYDWTNTKLDPDHVVVRKFIVIETSGTAIINNWQFIATVDHTEAGNILRGYADGVEIPARYYTSPPICEHCNSNRLRKYTYIIRNTKTGEFKQVGKSCLNDFTHGLSAEMVALYVSLHNELIAGNKPQGETHDDRYIKRDNVLPIIAETVAKFGYAKSDSVRSTKDRVTDYYNFFYRGFWMDKYQRRRIEDELSESGFDKSRPENMEKINQVMAWIASQPDESNYIHNLKVIAALEYIEYKDFGILASAIRAYDRAMEIDRKKEEEKKKGETSAHIGKIKERITRNITEYKCVTCYETMYGATYVYKFVDDCGNVLIWKTSKGIHESVKTITGTVKSHGEYNGVMQTELTRCKIA